MAEQIYDPQQVEAKWQAWWNENGTNQIDLAAATNPYYVLMMFPYPSAEGLHVGNVYAFTGADIHGRFKRLQGYDVFEPIGFDAFGIHSENYAMKVNRHPAELIPANVANFTRQLTMMGFMFDWRRTVDTTSPEYYHWTQWIFLQLYKAGFAYRDTKEVNYCPDCGTVISDEQVNTDGTCERHGETMVQRRHMPCWFFKITEFADRLASNHDWLDWSDTTKTAQLNWIGRSEGAEVDFEVAGTFGLDEMRAAGIELQERDILQIAYSANHEGKPHTGVSEVCKARITVFTTRPDTLFGATFMVLSPEHPLVDVIADESKKDEIAAYRAACAAKTEEERTAGDKEKTGVDTGARAINPVNGQEIPIFIADYVLMGYGTGAIMAVPSGDHRDFAFAKKFGLSVPCIIDPEIEGMDVSMVSGIDSAVDAHSIREAVLAGNAAWSGPGKMINSANDEISLNGLPKAEAVAKMNAWLESKDAGKPKKQFRLRDWGISRQRYWGPPIPIIYDEDGNAHPVPEDQLPVTLPDITDFRPKGDGRGPLANVPEWVNTTLPDGRPGRRETDVMDNFLDSAWYFLRYPSTGESGRAWDPEQTVKWLPVDMYIGGNEHAVLHLLYTRFICMALSEAGALKMGASNLKDAAEPFKKFRAHGLLIKEGKKMSKSKGNVVNPDDFVHEHGADTLRTYLMFLGPYQQGGDFRDKDIQGIRRFFNRVHAYYFEDEKQIVENDQLPKSLLVKAHQTIKKVGRDIESMSYNTAISALMELMNMLRAEDVSSDFAREAFCILLAPFAPHLTEEIWQGALGKSGSVFKARWPEYEEALTVLDEIEIPVQVNGKLRDKVVVARTASKTELEEAALQTEGVQRNLTDGVQVRRVIVVPGRLVNFIIK